jgi:hypothetical protein
MPNWCNNRVVISHEDTTKLEALATAIREGKFCNHVIPVPESLHIVAGRVGDDNDPKQIELEAQEKANLETHGYSTWYDFCVARWGTKWDIDPYDPADVQIKDNTIEFGFDSAWAPPIGIYAELVEQGFEVEATYYEPGMAYVGRWYMGDDDCIEYGGETSATVRELIGDELDDEYSISECMAEYEEENLEIDLDDGLSAVNEQEQINALTQKDE